MKERGNTTKEEKKMTKQATRVTAPSGKSSLIFERDMRMEYECVIAHQAIVYGGIEPSMESSTSPQPFVAINYDAAGKAVGGRTLTEGERANIIKAAKEKGIAVTEEEADAS